MTPDPRLNDLAKISAVLRDAKLMALSKAADEKALVEAALQALGDTVISPASTAPEAMAFIMHETWKTQKRRALNQIFAQKTAVWLQAQEDARHAFGRAEVLAKLVERSGS